MPPLNEGSILYMPTDASRDLGGRGRGADADAGRVLKSFPEVERVFGKAGRADTIDRPRPLSMMETTVVLRPWDECGEAALVLRPGAGVGPGLPEAVVARQDLVDELVDEMDRALRIPGVTNAWTMPIKARVDMLSTGVRTPIGIKVLGTDLAEIERVGREIEALLRDVPGPAACSPSASPAATSSTSCRGATSSPGTA